MIANYVESFILFTNAICNAAFMP